MDTLGFKNCPGSVEWRLDEIGLHEFRKGQPAASIPWADLERVDHRQICTAQGVCSTVFLPAKLKAKFYSALNAEWQTRFPDRFRANEARNLRHLTWRALLWLPLTCAIAIVATYYKFFRIAPRTGLPAQWLIQANLSIARGDHHIIVPPILAGRLLRFDITVVILALVLCSVWIKLIQRYRSFRHT